MRKLIVSEFLTFDGVMEAPNEWSFPFWNDEIAKYKHDELFASDTLLLGRVTYEGFAAAWPSRTGDNDFGDRMNSIRKVIASTTLNHLEWNNATRISGNVADEVYKLKQQPGQDILAAGSAMLIDTLIRNDLVDFYRLLVYPVVLGKGKRLFKEGAKAGLKLVESRTSGSGVLMLVYETVPEK